MATTTKAKPDNQNLARTRSLGRKPKLPSSSEDGSTQKPEKPLPNYLKPTVSSRPDTVKFLKKNNNSLDDNQKLLRRRSFDRPPSSLTSPSTSSQRTPKSLNVSPSRPRDRPAVPREKPVVGLRSSSFHGNRGGPRGGGTTAKSPLVAPNKSGLSSSSTTSLKGKRKGSAKVATTKVSDKEITLDSASLMYAQEDGEEILKVESDVQDSNDQEASKDEKDTKELQIEVAQADETEDEENDTDEPTTVASGEDCIVVAKEIEKEGEGEGEGEGEEEKLINEDKVEDTIEETEDQENSQENKCEEEEEIKKKIDEDETPEKVDIDINEAESVEETTKDKEEEEVKDEEKEQVKEEEEEEESGEGKKKEVVKGKKESPSAYNDVIASKMQENPRKNKVLALAGAFQTVIDYETAASK